MADVKVVDAAEILRVVDAFAAVTWPFSRDGFEAVVEPLGWTPGRERANGADFDTPYPIDLPMARVGFPDGVVGDVRVDLTDEFFEPTAEQSADLVAIARRLRDEVKVVWGKPVRSKGGQSPRFTWDLPNGGRFAIANLDIVVQLIILQKRYADIERGEERHRVPDDRDPLSPANDLM